MESLKPILLFVVLSGVGYGVYVALNHAPAPEPTSAASGEPGKPSSEFGNSGKSESAAGAADSNGKGSTSGAGLGMSGILNPMGTASNSPSASASAPERSVPQASSLPFGIGSTSIPSVHGESATQPADSTNHAPSSPAGDGNANPPLPGGTAAGPPADAQTRYEFEAARRNAQSLLNSGKLDEALRELSRWYAHPALQPDEQTALVELLGQLAGTVIYSRQHWLMPAYVVRSGDTLESIAGQYEIPWQLLAKINGIKNPRGLTAGQELKVIRGPFQGQLDLSQQWLTVFVDGMYAGRFRVETHEAINKPEGGYPVVKFSAENSPGMSAEGPRHITVGGDIQLLCPDEASAGAGGAWLGAIRIAKPDMDDVFDMLSDRSQVTIRR